MRLRGGRLAALALGVAMSGPAEAQPAPGEYSIPLGIRGGSQNLRSGPGQDHSVVAKIPAGAGGVQIFDCKPPSDSRSTFDFCRASWNGFEGWISSCCLVPARGGRAVDSTGRPPRTAEPDPAPSAGNPNQFNLVCRITGEYKKAREMVSVTPWPLEPIKVDLTARKFEDQLKREPQDIGAIEENRIHFRAPGGDGSYWVNRFTGEFQRIDKTGELLEGVVGTCTPGPFTGFSQRRF